MLHVDYGIAAFHTDAIDPMDMESEAHWKAAAQEGHVLLLYLPNGSYMLSVRPEAPPAGAGRHRLQCAPVAVDRGRHDVSEHRPAAARGEFRRADQALAEEIATEAQRGRPGRGEPDPGASLRPSRSGT